MQIKSKTVLDLLLLLVIIIFSALSAYTTKEGFALVWGGEDNVVRELMAWGIAIGSSLFMIFLSVQVADFIKDRRMLRLLIGYLTIASLSVFFNFNAIHGRQEKSLALGNDASELRQKIQKVRANSIKALESHFRLNELQKEVDSLQIAMSIELTHNKRPGAGKRHQRLREIHGNTVARLKAADRAFSPLKEQINAISTSSIVKLDSAIASNRESLMIPAMDDGKKCFEMIAAETASQIPGFNPPDVGFEFQKIERPDYTFYSVIQIARSAFSANSSFAEEDRARVYLSLLLSIALDFPIFFSLIILNWPKSGGSLRRIWNVPIFSKESRRSKRKSLGPFSPRRNQPNSNLWD